PNRTFLTPKKRPATDWVRIAERMQSEKRKIRRSEFFRSECHSKVVIPSPDGFLAGRGISLKVLLGRFRRARRESPAIRRRYIFSGPSIPSKSRASTS